VKKKRHCLGDYTIDLCFYNQHKTILKLALTVQTFNTLNDRLYNMDLWYEDLTANLIRKGTKNLRPVLQALARKGMKGQGRSGQGRQGQGMKGQGRKGQVRKGQGK